MLSRSACLVLLAGIQHALLWGAVWITKRHHSCVSVSMRLRMCSKVLKELFAQKLILAGSFLPRVIQDVDGFLSQKEQIWRTLALHHLLTNGSSAVNGCRQNESKQLIKTQVIHMTLVY